MKASTKRSLRRAGYAALPIVVSIGIFSMGSLAFVFRKSGRSQRQQIVAQVKVDYAQKEEAVLRALIAITPNKAIRAMGKNSANSPDNYSWVKIFEEAISLANAETSVDAGILGDVNIEGLIVANSGDDTVPVSNGIVGPIVGDTGLLNAGNTRDSAMLNDPVLGASLPAPLYSSSANWGKDKTFPLVGYQKQYSNSWRTDVLLDAVTHKHFNLIPYPDIRFGYARPGDNVIAKRNWWAFSLTFGKNNSQTTGVPPLTKNYLLSIYEIPTQLPLSAGNYMSVGVHGDGTAWDNVTIEGGLYANSLETQGAVSLLNGQVAGRRDVTLSNTTLVNGATVNANIDAMGVRETLLAASDNDFYDVSLAGNSGRVAIIPLNTGERFLRWQVNDGNALSPQKYSTYANGARQCKMRIRVMEMQSSDAQVPVWVRFYYKNASGSTSWGDYKRSNGTWPPSNETGGSEMPFQTEELDVGRHSLSVYPERFPAFLASLGASDVSVNKSLFVYPDRSRTGVNEAAIPSTDDDLAVTLRECEDLSPYTKGFSLVTDCRLYFAGSFNQVAIPVPADSGLPTDFEFYPPTSIFAPEKRYGIHLFDRNVDFDGQLSSLKTDEADAYRPLDFVTGDGETVASSQINANLKGLISPAQLPPISIMNWMVTIEEIE